MAAAKNDSSPLTIEQRHKVISDHISDYAAKTHDKGYSNNNDNVNE